MKSQFGRLRTLSLIVSGIISGLLVTVIGIVVLTQSIATPTKAIASTPPETETAVLAPSTLGLALPTDGLTVDSLDGLEPISPSNADRIREVGRVGRGAARGVAWSPDGRWLAVASMTGVYFYDADTFEAVGFLNSGATDLIAFSPVDNSLIAVLSITGQVTLWDTSTGSQVRVLSETGYSFGWTRSFNGGKGVFSPDGQWLVANNAARQVVVWEVANGQVLRILEGNVGRFAPDGTLLVGGDAKAGLSIWDVRSGREIRALAAQGVLPNLDFSADGKLLGLVWLSTAGQADAHNPAVIFNLETGEERQLNNLNRDDPDWQPTDIVFAPDGAFVESGGVLFDLAGGQSVRPLRDYPQSPWVVAFSPDGKRLAALSVTVGIWQVSNGEKIKTLDRHMPALDVTFPSASQPAQAIVNYYHAIEIWDLVSGETVRRFDMDKESATALFSPQGPILLKFLALDNGACQIMIGDGTTNPVAWRAYAELELEICDSITFSPDGSHVATYNEAGEISLWDIGNGEKVGMLRRSNSWWLPTSLTFSPDSTLLGVLATDPEGGPDFTVHAVADGRTMLKLPGFAGTVIDITFSANNSRLAVTSITNEAKTAVTLWAVETGKMDQTIDISTQVDDLVFSADGSLLAILTQDAAAATNSVTLWDVAGGRLLTTLSRNMAASGPHGNTPPRNFGFLADGKLLAIVARDETIRLWGVTQP